VIRLRPYQERAIELLRERHTDRPLLCLPTGAGKTSVAAELIRACTARGRRAIFLVHRRELVKQALDRLAQFGLDPGCIAAGFKPAPHKLAQVSSIQTLDKRAHWPASLVIVDECAHAASVSWTRVLSRYHGSTIVGLTATPMRLDGRALAPTFGCIIEPVTTRELIDAGHLVEPRVFAPPIDLKGIKVVRGDYSLPEVAERMSKLTGDIVGTWFDRTPGQPTVAFATSIDHSRAIVEAFQARGVEAAHLDYKLSAGERDDVLERLASGRLTLVSQVQLLSEGWDLPALQCAILARPTKSLALFRQMVGRVMRPPGPVTVLDHAGNHHEHGVVTAPVAWTLDPDKPPPKPGGEALRTCPECFAVIPLASRECPDCGEDLTDANERERPAVVNPGELIEFDPKDIKRAAVEDYPRLVQLASERAWKVGWARKEYHRATKSWPKLYSIEREHYVCPGHQWEPVRGRERCAMCLTYRDPE
jgi:DNA repair protein RadD